MVRMAASLASDLFSLCAVNSQFVSLRCAVSLHRVGDLSGTVAGANQIARCDSQVFPSISFSVVSAPKLHLGPIPCITASLNEGDFPFGQQYK